jgi:hypothetical protein
MLRPKLIHHGLDLIRAIILTRCQLVAELSQAHVARERLARIWGEGAAGGLMRDPLVRNFELMWCDASAHNRLLGQQSSTGEGEMPNFKIEFVAPGGVRKKPGKRLTPREAGIRAQLEHLYPVKALIEKLFGKAAFMKIKMGGSMNDWRDAATKLLDAIGLSVKSTVKIADEDWFKEIAETVTRSKTRIREADTIDGLLSYLVQGLAELVFIQLGNFPMHRISQTTPLTPKWWTLTGYRSVQYVQTDKQKKAQACLNETRAANARRAAAQD